LLDARGQRHRTRDRRPGALRGLDDLRRGLVDQLVVVGLEPDPDALLCHLFGAHSRIFVTTPAPTVLPPSRMAKRRPSSRAIGLMSVTVRVPLWPAMTISVPAGSSADPVTSVVRMENSGRSPLKNGVCPPPVSLEGTERSAVNLVCS